MPLRFCVLASGSLGNCTLVSSGSTHLLIDGGSLPRGYVLERLAEIGLRYDDLHAVLLTHAHGDHLGAVALGLADRVGVPIYLHPSILEAKFETALGRRRQKRLRRMHAARRVRTFDGSTFPVRDLAVAALETPHGEVTAIGAAHAFVVRSAGPRPRTLFYATDLGHLPAPLAPELAGADAAVLESNHDVELERVSTRPERLKAWVLSDRGHLSNAQACAAVAGSFGADADRARTLVLAHLSRECNTPDLARAAMTRALADAGIAHCALHLARQDQRTELLEV